jgi:hypothetical protein
MRDDLERGHLDLQARFDRLKRRLAVARTDDDRSQILAELVLFGDEVSALLKIRPHASEHTH